MYALTLWQPWATLLVAGIKQVETRSWSAQPKLKLPSKILIHASVRPIKKEEIGPIHEALPPDICLKTRSLKYPLGSVIGSVTVVSSTCMDEDSFDELSEVEEALGLWQPGRWAWGCTNAVMFNEPIKCKGRQGFWRPDLEILFELEENCLL